MTLLSLYSALRLQLNPSKTELIWFGTRCNLNKIPHEHLSLSVGSSIVPSSAVVRDLVVLLDSELSMKHHISKVTSTCYYHLRRLHQIRNYISRETMIQLVISFVIFRIDYCSSVLVGLQVSTLAPLQRVQIQNHSGLRLRPTLLTYSRIVYCMPEIVYFFLFTYYRSVCVCLRLL